MREDRTIRKIIFEDTLKICSENEVLKNAIKNSKQNQYLVKDEEELKVDSKQNSKEKANIVISKKRSFEAAKNYKNQKVCVLNFASFLNPGGGVKNGSNAQEEALCRCSTLYMNLIDNKMLNEFYSEHRNLVKNNKINYLYNDDCIFTPNVVVFKTDEKRPKLMEEKYWYDVDIITCAAPKLRNEFEKNENEINQIINSGKLKQIIEKRIKKILSIAKSEKEDVVILGAFGCGAFKNPPEIVAEAIKDAIKEFEYDFKTIEFAIYCTPNNMTNYDVFKEYFK